MTLPLERIEKIQEKNLITKNVCSLFKILDGQIGKMYFEEIQQELEDIRLGRAHGFFAFDKTNGVLGYASWRKRVEVAYLETIVVKLGYQGQGIGSKLHNELEKDVIEKKINLLNVVTDADAQKTISFYLKNNFEISGYVDNEFILDTKQVHLTKRLNLK
jgi:GNAT superfamily N-acetyltransferase